MSSIYNVETQILKIMKKEGRLLNARDLNSLLRQISTGDLTEALGNLEVSEQIFRDCEGNYFCPNKNCFITRIKASKNNSPYVVINGKFFYVKDNELNSAQRNDLVLVKLTDDSKQKVKVMQVLERHIKHIVCEVVEKEGVKQLVPFKAMEKFKVYTDNEVLKNLVNGERILVELDKNKVLDSYYGKFISCVGHKDEPDMDMKCVALNNGFNINFSPKALEELKTIPTEVQEEETKNREDLRDEVIFTIDGNDSKDLDDAISIKELPNGNILLKVHISHVSHYVKPNMHLFKEADERGTSVYTPNCVLPMFPPKISNGICSLNPQVDRLTRTTEIEYDKNGKIVSSRIYQSVINSKKKMTYEDLNNIFATGEYTEEYKLFEKEIELARKLNKILEDKKNNRGAIKFDGSEIKFVIDEDKNIKDVYCRKCKEAENIIENFMLAANETITKHAIWANIPFIYRNHDIPEKEKVDNAVDFLIELGYKVKHTQDVNCPKSIRNMVAMLSDKEEFPILSRILLKAMKKAEYSTLNLGHYGLSLQEYTHSTSPIRRFPDLLVHTIFDNLDNFTLDTQEFKSLERKLVSMCSHSSIQERKAELVEEQVNTLKALEYASSNIGKEFDGFIEYINNNSVYVRTTAGIGGLLKIKGAESKNYTIGEKVKVKIKEVSKETCKIFFDLCYKKESTGPQMVYK